MSDGKLQSGLQQSCSGGDPPQASSMVDSVYLASDPLNETGPETPTLLLNMSHQSSREHKKETSDSPANLQRLTAAECLERLRVQAVES